jgi:hypothetical protein
MNVDIMPAPVVRRTNREGNELAVAVVSIRGSG